MDNPATIRLARPDDARTISDLITATVEEFVTPEFSEEGRQTLLSDLSFEGIRGHLADPAFRYHVYEDPPGRIVGLAATRNDSHLFALYVAAAFHGRGIARQLWNVAREASLAAGASGEFTVNASRYAVGVYERFGFVREGGEKEHEGVVFIPMRLRL